ncbi:MAG: ribonuclease HII [Actinobacteria bacterium]|nr:ribonuclease HII [Actinomycetota bacterium]
MEIEQILHHAELFPLAGVDEAGRGACAGPLVVAAVILRDPFSPALARVKDSKEIREVERESLFDIVIEESLAHCIVEISPNEIDERGVHAANIDGMRRAVLGLALAPRFVLTDGYAVPGLAIPSLGVWKGDQVVHCISAASILAKVTRDRIMRTVDSVHPQYGFAKHKGYSTLQHMNAIREFGPSQLHRRSFANVATIINITE